MNAGARANARKSQHLGGDGGGGQGVDPAQGAQAGHGNREGRGQGGLGDLAVHGLELNLPALVGSEQIRKSGLRVRVGEANDAG